MVIVIYLSRLLVTLINILDTKAISKTLINILDTKDISNPCLILVLKQGYYICSIYIVNITPVKEISKTREHLCCKHKYIIYGKP